MGELRWPRERYSTARCLLRLSDMSSRHTIVRLRAVTGFHSRRRRAECRCCLSEGRVKNDRKEFEEIKPITSRKV